MKNNLLLILLLVVFTGFCGKEDGNMGFASVVINKGPAELPPKITKIYPPDRVVEAKVYDTVWFGVDYEAYPDATCTVYRNNEPLMESENVEIVKDDEGIMVKLLDVQEEDSGDYSIVLRNSVGETKVTFRVEIA